MALGSILGGSPLGLIDVWSGTTNGKQSSFNDGSHRATNVEAYNRGYGNANTSLSGSEGFQGNSLFSGFRVVRAWPGIKEFTGDSAYTPGSDIDDDAILKDNTLLNLAKTRKSLHNDDVYDTSIMNIIEHFASTRGSLKMADFAYLKDIGVYPNNRLMIARRFATAVGDNIIAPRKKNKNGSFTESAALATMISWVKPGDENFISFTFGEKWVDSEADFKGIMNRIGDDMFGANSKVGGILSGLGGSIPLPGFSEIGQRKFLTTLGLIENPNMVPAGNPNLIKESKRRATIPQEQAGSGLDCQVNIKMICEYELKFISGIDPTIVWMDILGMITRFGTSPSSYYGLSTGASSAIQSFMNNPLGMLKKVAEAALNGFKEMGAQLGSKIQEMATEMQAVKSEDDKVKDFVKERMQDPVAKKYWEEQKATYKTTNGADMPSTELEKQQKKYYTEGGGKDVYEDYKAQQEKDKNKAAVGKVKDGLVNAQKAIEGLVVDGLNTIARKYKVEMMGIVHALSGLPSTPWHITVGNPLRPVFCAGDMYTTSVSLTLGPTLAFNDLPSTIKAEFTLQNARPWGMGEIMAKFNSGYLRTVDSQRTFLEIEPNYKVGDSTEDPGSFSFIAGSYSTT
jgi:hypothetical protein